MSRIRIRRYRTPALLLVGMAVVFLADVSTPLGIAVWLLYLPFVLATLYVDSPRAPWVVAACATLLIAISFGIKPPSVPWSIALVNRALAAVALWTSAALVHRVGRSEEALLSLTRTLEERVKRRTAELEESNAALEAFGYSVSHDLRAPLRTMQGFAKALLEDHAPLLGEAGRDYAARITSGAARMDQLIQDLLAYSRLSRTEIRAQPVDLEQVLRAAERQVEGVLREKHASLAIRTPLPRVLGHETTLVQVFANLLSNALKFTGPGVRPSVDVWSERRGGHVRVLVRDNGIGIEPEHRDRIFAVFERLHGTEAYPGTGIGLAIVKKGIERLRGRAGVDSSPGQGSTFWIELPEHAPVAATRVSG